MPEKVHIRKILIANRGEIAVRVIRACREMGIKTVAVYSEIDICSLHVRLADEACHIGPSPANESYLRIDRIIDAALKTGADAVHPGYGFLAENPELAKICNENDIVFIGPDHDVIQSMGEKTIAKQTMIKAGIPTIPGADKSILDVREAREIAEEIGYPVILKASMGGGGRGMRIVHEPRGMDLAFWSAKSEALAAFGSESVFMEKYILNPRHIEFQILADRHGNVVHLGERDCTLQRRNQKLLEEAPSPFINRERREKMGTIAVNAAKAANYQSAGTVEFLIDAEDNFYFMEMNTRIQVEHPVTEMVTGVEHPVTEMVTGIDLIKEQIRIAQGEKLRYQQEDIRVNGCSIECRINAEDAFADFIPNPGRIESIRFPMGPGIRVDTAVFNGYEIPRQYDSLIAKVVVHAPNRRSAINRMETALTEMKIKGIRSTKEFHLALMKNRDFRNSQYDTSFIEKNIDRLKMDLSIDEEAAAVATAVDVFLYTQRMTMGHHSRNEVGRNNIRNSWRLSRRFNARSK